MDFIEVLILISLFLLLMNMLQNLLMLKGQERWK